MSAQIVPLTVSPNQTFAVQLTVNGQTLTLNLTLTYVAMSGWWHLQVANAQNIVLVASVPLITGYYPSANILAQYGYLGIGAAYLLNTGNDANDYPGQDDLTNYSLLWSDNA